MAALRIKIISAFPLSAAEKKRLRAALSLKLGEGYLYSYKIDEKLIGGVRIETPDTVFDASIQGKLAKLRSFIQ